MDAGDRARRQLRTDYRELIDGLDVHQTQFLREDFDLNGQMDRANELFSRVNHTREAALDSHSVAIMSDILVHRTRALQSNSMDFDISVFFRNISRNFTRNCENDAEDSEVSECNWNLLGKQVAHCFKRPVVFSFLSGHFKLPTLPKTRRKTQKDQVSSSIVRPSQISRNQQECIKETTTESVEKLYTRIVNESSIDEEETDESPLYLFEVVSDPNSFSSTVESLYHLSFLAKNGSIKLKMDENELPYVSPTTQEEKSHREDDNNKQMIVSMDYKTWKNIVDVWDIQESFMETNINNVN